MVRLAGSMRAYGTVTWPCTIDASAVQVQRDVGRGVDPRLGNVEHAQIRADQVQLAVRQSVLPAQVPSTLA